MGWFRNMRPFRDFGDDPQEVNALEERIIRKVRETVEKRPEPGRLGNPMDYEAFVGHRFGHHLRNYRRYGGAYALAFTMLSVVAIGSGAASAAIAAGWGDDDNAKELLVILGLLAASSAAINQLWRPAQKASSRYRGANGLVTAGWSFLLNRGVFAKLKPDEAVETFVDEVMEILKQTASVDEGIAEGGTPGAPAGQ